MKVLSCFSLTLCLFFQLNAQCDYEVSVEGDTLLCPNSTGQLKTQEFDAYQWMKRAYNENFATPIDGATEQFLDINSVADGGYYFSVEVTDDNCTESSAEVLIEGYYFLPIYVISLGDFQVGNNGGSIICEGDSMFFEVGAPYNKNITWYKDGVVIPDETSTKLTVKESGSYTVSAAPGECPSYLQPLGLNLAVEVISCNTGTKEIGKELIVDFYPNPVNEYALVKSTERVDSYVVMGVDGTILFNRQAEAKEFEADLSSLVPGIYFMRLHSGYNSETIKFIVQ